MDPHSRSLVSRKIKTPAELAKILGPGPRQRKAIMCHGVFDVVHPGHVRHLLYAKSKADILIASITADGHIKKADFRPYVPEDLRAINLAALEVVDYVVIDRNATPIDNLKIIQPDYFAKGYEYTAGEVLPKTQEEIEALESYGGEIIFTPGDIVYSSSRIIEDTPPDISVEKLLLALDGEHAGFSDLVDTLDGACRVKVHVVGDTIIDTITETTMIGGMTKTPTISVRLEEKQDFVGGAGIVAKHLCAAGADVTFSTVLGDDHYKDYALRDLQNAGIRVEAVVDPTRPTTNKNAIVTGGYRLLKVDTLDNRSISDRIQERLALQIAGTEADVVIFSDFRHGIFNRETIASLIDAIPSSALRVADSQVASRWGNILEYQGFDLITPNEREARFATGDQDSVVQYLAAEVHAGARCKTLIMKLGSRGILLYRTRKSGDPRTVVALESLAESVVDPVGAGDALLAYASLALCVSGNDVAAAILGNLAAGLACEVDGNQPVQPEAMRRRLRQLENVAQFSQAEAV